MHIALIAAMGKSRVMGNKNRLPWHLPADLKYFKKITLGKPILMGRKTYESIGKPLPGRLNIVLTRDPNFSAEGVDVVHSLKQGLQLAKAQLDATGHAQGEVMIIGGASLFAEALPLSTRLYLTYIHEAFPGDTFFPDVDLTQWRQTEREDCSPEADNPYPYSFVVYHRVTP